MARTHARTHAHPGADSKASGGRMHAASASQAAAQSAHSRVAAVPPHRACTHMHAAVCTFPCSVYVHSRKQHRVLKAATRGLSVCMMTQPYTVRYIRFTICCVQRCIWKVNPSQARRWQVDASQAWLHVPPRQSCHETIMAGDNHRAAGGRRTNWSNGVEHSRFTKLTLAVPGVHCIAMQLLNGPPDSKLTCVLPRMWG